MKKLRKKIRKELRSWDTEAWVKAVSSIVLLPFAIWVFYFLVMVARDVIQKAAQ